VNRFVLFRYRRRRKRKTSYSLVDLQVDREHSKSRSEKCMDPVFIGSIPYLEAKCVRQHSGVSPNCGGYVAVLTSAIHNEQVHVPSKNAALTRVPNCCGAIFKGHPGTLPHYRSRDSDRLRQDQPRHDTRTQGIPKSSQRSEHSH